MQHFVSISGGKDSTAVACLAVERAQTHPGFVPRFQFCDVENEDAETLAHVDYLEEYTMRQLGVRIERLSAYDVPGLIDAEAFARKRISIQKNWPIELRRKRHAEDCDKRRGCPCPIIVSPPVAQDRIEQAIAALEPSGNAFLDMCLIHGRFPSKKAKFCTDELKMQPLHLTRKPLWAAGLTTVDWVGERALESKDRAAKPMLQRIRHPVGTQIIYRPIHQWTAAEVFAIAKRHGLKPNPLYLWGAGRVGCWPCINARKEEIAIISRRSPAKIDQLRDWERRVSMVSRRDQGGEGMFATFFSADKVPGDPDDWNRGQIDKVVAWTGTTRGGRQFDLMQALDDIEAEEMGLQCQSQYGLCE